MRRKLAQWRTFDRTEKRLDPYKVADFFAMPAMFALTRVLKNPKQASQSTQAVVSHGVDLLRRNRRECIRAKQKRRAVILASGNGGRNNATVYSKHKRCS